MRRLLVWCAMILAGVSYAGAQILSPIVWNVTSSMTSDNEGEIVFSATIEDGWHLYGLNLPEGGPKATSIDFDKLEGMTLVGDITPSVAPTEKVDMVFHLTLNWWEKDVKLVQKFKTTGDKGYSASGVITFQGCNDGSCIPPSREPFEVSSPGFISSPAEDDAVEEAVAATPVAAGESGWWTPVVFPEGEAGAHSIADSSWWYIFIWGFVGGLIALLTPCVWPMIPLTVSFFLKKNGSKGKSVRDAMIYGAGIIVIYLVLGLAITLIFGASKLNDLATNAVFNLLFFLLLVVFAISFFGAFDIKLPSKWSNGVDSKAEKTTGMISIFFMAFTLVLVSFSCTGPIIGTLLVEAASVGDITGPAIGMGAFALALAIPFTLFAIFPSWLKEMPRSGGWLNSVKVVLGFLELALSLKFLSVADLAYGWGILDREVFVSLWVVIFILLGMYLLGKIRFSHDSELEHVSIGRFFMALISFSFAVYLVPGLWGAPLKSVSAFVPPLYTQDFNLYAGGQFKEFDDYDEGMRFAAESGRPVLIDFSGYGCVNCRKMEGAVFDTEVISDIIKKDFVLIKLMVDDKQTLQSPITVKENGKDVKLTTVGEKWSYLQRSKFAANSQPYYVMLNNEGEALAVPYYYDENVEKFGSWLENGVKQYVGNN
ncbi:MAG: thioredoxin family protein [Paramuribaculum sp.]|nr:thioredoxin family protein [Paramuribaculum sp.]